MRLRSSDCERAADWRRRTLSADDGSELRLEGIDFCSPARAQLAAQRLRSAGVNVQLATSDWGGVVTRRAVKAAPDQGGWNIFITWAGAAAVGSPMAFIGHQTNGEKGWFGWPTNEEHEKLRDKWAAAAGIDEQKAIAREIQKNAWNFVPHVWLGQWSSPVAYRKNLNGVLKDSGCRSILEYREGVAPLSSRTRRRRRNAAELRPCAQS